MDLFDLTVINYVDAERKLSALSDIGYMFRDGRIYNDRGEFAILVSPKYGAGWSTWGANLFDPLAVVLKLFTDSGQSDYDDYKQQLYPDAPYVCSAGFNDCDVIWIKPGTKFKIDEYDGCESIAFQDDDSIWQS
jgi:hypothetical protein